MTPFDLHGYPRMVQDHGAPGCNPLRL